MSGVVRDLRHKRAKGVMRIRNFLARFSGVFGGVVRDCCPNRARLGGSRGALFFSRLALRGFADQRASSSTRVDSRSRKREFFDNLKPCNLVQPHATWCNQVQPESPLRKTNPIPRTDLSFPRFPRCPKMCRNVPECSIGAKWQNEPISRRIERKTLVCQALAHANDATSRAPE